MRIREHVACMAERSTWRPTLSIIKSGVSIATYSTGEWIEKNLKNLKCKSIQCSKPISFLSQLDTNVISDSGPIYGIEDNCTVTGSLSDNEYLYSEDDQE